MSDLFTKKTYRKLYKLYKHIKGIKMKKLLTSIIILVMPSYIFALAGFGIQFGQDFSKLDGKIEYENQGTLTEVKVESIEMSAFPVGLGGYAFVDLFGFALETNKELENAKKKLKEKKLDAIILNSLNDEGAGFGFNTNKITFIDDNLYIKEYPLMSKKEVSKIIVKQATNMFFNRFHIKKKITK